MGLELQGILIWKDLDVLFILSTSKGKFKNIFIGLDRAVTAVVENWDKGTRFNNIFVFLIYYFLTLLHPTFYLFIITHKKGK